eukprot:GHRR01005614.1.p2 GENE.GHRR01005614.1~~GHRR01005614.1.p2  ORF type:complete len:112 (+),score=11.05 GHRR01005614.1:162-497(+)
MDSLVVENIDGEPLDRDKARTLAKRVFFAGFALLPWLWAVNVWMFWPGLRQGDPVVKTYARRSAYCFVGWLSIILPWILIFSIFGPAAIGKDAYSKLDAYQIDLAAWGIGF